MGRFTRILVLLCAGATVVHAQSAKLEGRLVRVVHPKSFDPLVVGTLERRVGDTVVIRSRDRAELTTIVLREARTLEVNLGRKRNIGKSTMIGLGLGAGFGAIVGFVGGDKKCDSKGLLCISPREGAAIGGTFLGAVGAAVGLVVGSFRTEDWVSAGTPRLSVEVRAAPMRELRVGPRISF